MCILHHPHPSTCVSKGSGHISDGCGNDAEKGEWRLNLAALEHGHLSFVVTSVLPFLHCTLGYKECFHSPNYVILWDRE